MMNANVQIRFEIGSFHTLLKAICGLRVWSIRSQPRISRLDYQFYFRMP